VFEYKHICVHIYVLYICIYVCLYVYTCIHIYLHVYKYTDIYPRTCIIHRGCFRCHGLVGHHCRILKDDSTHWHTLQHIATPRTTVQHTLQHYYSGHVWIANTSQLLYKSTLLNRTTQHTPVIETISSANTGSSGIIGGNCNTNGMTRLVSSKSNEYTVPPSGTVTLRIASSSKERESER